MSTSPGAVPPAPPSFEKRLPMALALMMLVLLGWQYFFKPPTPKPVVTPNAPPKVQVTGETPAAATPPVNPNEPLPPGGVSSPVQASAESMTEVDSDLYHIVFTNRGAVVKSWVLKKYKDDDGKPLQLVNASSGLALPFAIEFTGQKPDLIRIEVLFRHRFRMAATL